MNDAVAERFNDLMGCLDSPMAVVTTAAADERAGCLIGFGSQCSINPGRYAVWLSKANHTFRVGLHASHFAVHFLTEDDHDVAELFGTLSGDDVDKFERCQFRLGPAGVPLLDRCPNRIVVSKHTMLDDGSDHVCMVTEPVDAHFTGLLKPLRLSDVGDLTPGHTVDERPQPPTERDV